MRIHAMLLCLILIGCSPIVQQTSVDKPLNSEQFSSVGDTIVNVELKESLPNSFGNADLFGRTRTKGLVQIVYLGLNESSRAVFERRDTNIFTNETAMNQSGFRSNTFVAQPYGNGAILTGMGQSAPSAIVAPIGDRVTNLELDLNSTNTITVQDIKIKIVEATQTGIRYVLLR